MSEILCRWLNEELRLSKAVEPKTFAKSFSSGYLIGEVLHKHQLQSDFSMFMKKDTSVSHLNNFTRLEPTLQSLGVPFDMNTAQGVMREEPGAARQLLYQLYVLLDKKTATDISQPVASAEPQQKDHKIYSDGLHPPVGLDAELKLQKISQHYQEETPPPNDHPLISQPVHQRRPVDVQDEKRMKNMEKLKIYREKHNDIMNCNQASIVQTPKPPPYTLQLNLKKRQRQQQRREQQVQAMQTEIAQFETNRKKLVTLGFASPSSGQAQSGEAPLPGSGAKLMLQSSTKYIQELRQRLHENAVAREQRDKRRDRFLMEQLRAHEAQEEARREEQLVKRLTRQTQQEQRLANQLLQIHRQKEVILENRLFRESQYQQRREADFREALEREAALAQQAKLESAEEIRKELEFCRGIAAERAQRRYMKHFESCKGIMEQIVDLATKVGEYRLITGNVFSQKVMRGWKEVLLRGLPLYEPMSDQQPWSDLSTPLDPVELEKQELLKNQDYDDYANMAGDWAWPVDTEEAKLPLTNNNILGHVVMRLTKMVQQPVVEAPSMPALPHFTLKACVLGKFCSGKTTCTTKIAQAHGIRVLSAETLIKEAMKAHQNGEEEESKPMLTSSTSLRPDLDTQPGTKDRNVKKLSARAQYGLRAKKELRGGKPISNELLVDIIVEAVRRVPAQSGWILDGFPADITQAHLLEKALGGSVVLGRGVVDKRRVLAADPNPPAPPPPPAPALDLVLLLDIPDERVVKRALGHTDADTAASMTTNPTEKRLYKAQVPHRITSFQDTWPGLGRWFDEKQNILVRVDADVDEEELLRRVESVLQQAMMQKHEATFPVDDVELDGEKAPASSSSSTPPAEDKPLALTVEDQDSTESHSSLNQDQDQNGKEPSKSREQSKMESISSVTSKDPKTPPDCDSPCPGSSGWIYADEPIPPEIPGCICPHWEAVCDSYVNSVKTVMLQLRSQSTFVDHHLYNISEEFKHFLGRPNLKQELVSQWQKDFNSIPDDMREDEETRAELHLRLDELYERLWDISDKRKEEDEKEMAAVSERWVEEHTAVVINHHSALMQAEFDRFQNTLVILKVYYSSMQPQVLPGLPYNYVCIPLLNKEPEESSETTGTSVSNQPEDGEEKRVTKFIPFVPKRPGPEVTKTKNQAQPVPVKPSHEKLITDYEETLAAIRKLVAAEVTKPKKDKAPEADKVKPAASANKDDKGKQSSKQKGPPSGGSEEQEALAPSPDPDVDKEKVRQEEIRNKIQQECAAALDHEENSAKVRIALLKAHGLVLMDSIQSRAENTLSSMQKWMEAQYVAEIKSIDRLSQVVRHHIEASAKLQNELVLELTDFYVNGDCTLLASPPPLCRPPPLEKDTQSTLTIAQLERLHKELCSVAPAGLFTISEFFTFLQEIISVNMSRNILPNPWLNKNEKQLMAIVSLLKDDRELIDWRRFLLSAALPWPLPALTQLLVVLQRFKATDAEGKGYITEEQFLQTELWFSTESSLTVPEDPTEPLPYDRLANLRKFFFKLFAEHSVSPARLDYVFMLQYFAADPSPRRGFIRALSVVLGQYVKHSSSMGHLVKSMPSIVEGTELGPSDLDTECSEEDALCESSSLFGDQEVSVRDLLSVIYHKATETKDGIALSPGCMSQQEYTAHLVKIYQQLGYEPEDRVPFSVLCQHPLIQSLMNTSTHYQLVNIHKALLDLDEEATNLTASLKI